MLDSRRGKAYREILAGLRYHRGEKLSFLTFGFKRGSSIDCRMATQKLMTWVKREHDFRVDYFRVEVLENNSPDEKWRQHVHLLWNAPYIRQSLLVDKLQTYIGERGHVFIKLIDGDDKRAARYLMQYLGNQEGSVHYTMSRNWLPAGYRAEWKALKQDFYEKVQQYPHRPLQSDCEVLQEISRCDDTWRKTVLVDMMNDWIDGYGEKREVQDTLNFAVSPEQKSYNDVEIED
jgi:hypothetical protein